MSLQVVIARPPADIYEACDRKFHVRGRRYLCWTVGGLLYNPDNAYLPAWLMAHEEVHSKRQLGSGDVPGWWDQYLENKHFRFEEELVAHQEEWRVAKDTLTSRQDRRKQLAVIVDRLSGPVYGYMVRRDEAKRLITSAAV